MTFDLKSIVAKHRSESIVQLASTSMLPGKPRRMPQKAHQKARWLFETRIDAGNLAFVLLSRQIEAITDVMLLNMVS